MSKVTKKRFLYVLGVLALPAGYLLSDFFKGIRKIIFVFQQGTNSCLLAV